ncbi:phosphoribosylanthranilate isomerase [Altericista sp. CCNU0014]|uniref:phosphoribosylanthranilate isomerase n=1 Tax=Altericista sp. CCNU0014 TaxID=3082949 RepID=UPI00384A5460
MSGKLRVKICGLTRSDQAEAIAALGADALGFICVPQSPRYIAPPAIAEIVKRLPGQSLNGGTLAKIGVFANASLEQIVATVDRGALTGVQLHGQESPAFCRALRLELPQIELVKAFRVQTADTLALVETYASAADTFLLDAFNPHALGGTGETWDWGLVEQFAPERPWFLAGGLNVGNAIAALARVNPSGIDLSSGVEVSPGDKDLALVKQLFKVLSDKI